MTPETTTVVVYLLQYMLGVPPQPFSIVSIPNLPSLEECTYLAHELLPGIPEPKFRCIRYQTAAPFLGEGATPSESVAATWRADPHDEDNAVPIPRPRPAEAAVSEADEDDEACAAGAVTCKLPDTVTGTPNGIRIPRTKIEHEFGTLFGTRPRDGRAAPLNELVIATRSTFFRIFILPVFLERLGEKLKEGQHS